MKEIERRWLVSEDPTTNDKFMREVGDAYYEDIMSVYREGVRVRLRSPYGGSNNPPLIERTVKSGDGIVREERTCIAYPKSDLDFKIETLEPFIRKTRVWLPNRMLCKELVLDMFYVPRSDLVIIEAEFDTEEEAGVFVLPDYTSELKLEEVTGKDEYSNYALAQETKRIYDSGMEKIGGEEGYKEMLASVVSRLINEKGAES